MREFLYRFRILATTTLVLIVCIIISFFLKPYASEQKKLIRQIIPQKPSYSPTLPTLQKIFSDDHTWVARLPSDHITTLIVTGDIIPARSVNVGALSRNNFLWTIEKTADFLKNADITFINLETPLLQKCAPTVEGMIFCGDARHIQALVASGVDVVSLANNHAGNYGEEGVAETIKLLTDKGIAVTGNNRPTACPTSFTCGYNPIVQKTIRGIRFAFLGFNDITKPQPGVLNVDSDINMQELIYPAREWADVVVVTFHWGTEYQSQPDARQIELAHRAIDYGADLVIGNHPHWIQPIEVYKGKLITYAHGNFIFDQMWSQKTREGVVGKYTFYDNQLIDVQYFPVQIDDYGQPHFTDGEQKARILKDMYDQSLILASPSAH